MPKTELKHIPLDLIHEPSESLRKVDKTSEKYIGIVESVKLIGISAAISVREILDPETGEMIYGLIDGLHRFTAAKDAGCEDIPAQVMTCSDADLLEAQIMANVHKVETRPVEYSKALLKILMNNPLMTMADLAVRLAKTSSWISERLGLLKLTDDIGKLVDDDKIGLSNAYALAKLPQEEQADFVDRAMVVPANSFAPVVNSRIKELRDAKRKGRDATPEEFQPIPILRSRRDLVAELETSTIGPFLCEEVEPADLPAAFQLGILWALNLDPRSIEVQKAQDEERRAEKKRVKEASQIERKKKRAKEAAEKAAKLKEEAEGAEKDTSSKKAAAAELAAG